MGVPRTIGIILQNALIQAETEGSNKKISVKDVNVGLRFAKKMYMQQFQGAVKKKYQNIWMCYVKTLYNIYWKKVERLNMEVNIFYMLLTMKFVEKMKLYMQK